jgi:hypothetical protein
MRTGEDAVATRRVRVKSRVVSVATLFVMTTGVFAVVVPIAGAAPGAPCRVTNLTTQQVYTGKGQNLQTAINQAALIRTELRVRGVCVGSFFIAKKLTLTGHSTAAFPTPTLDGNASGTVLTVSGTAGPGSVTLRNLTITNGSAAEAGGGIRNTGRVILEEGSSVTGNTAAFRGGGIYNTHILTVRDSSSVAENTALGEGAANRGEGGGIFSAGGSLTLNGRSTVSGNISQVGGGIFSMDGAATMNGRSSVYGNEVIIVAAAGGIYNFNGTFTMNDSSSVKRNIATRFETITTQGGGIYNDSATLILTDSSAVSGNTSFDFGGGIFNIHNATIFLDGSSAVTRNTAGDAGGGILNHFEGPGTIFACDTWTGAISPNTPDDPPALTPIAC